MTDRPAHDLAQHVAAAFIRRNDAVVDEERGGAGVVSVDAQAGFGNRVVTMEADQLASLDADGGDQICFVVRQFPLQNGRNPLETHAGVDGRTGKRRHLAGLVAVELHENQVPDFDEASAAVEREILMLAAFLGRLRAVVEMDFRARSAGAGVAHLPEVVLLIKAENAGLRNASHFLPQVLGVVVFTEDREVELVFGQAELDREQLPSEGDGVALKVVAEREVPEHFKERVVAAGVADVFQIVMLAAGADALL